MTGDRLWAEIGKEQSNYSIVKNNLNVKQPPPLHTILLLFNRGETYLAFLFNCGEDPAIGAQLNCY